MRYHLVEPVPSDDIGVLQTKLEGFLEARENLERAKRDPKINDDQMKDLVVIETDLVGLIAETRQKIGRLQTPEPTKSEKVVNPGEGEAFRRVGDVLRQFDDRLDQLEQSLSTRGTSGRDQGIRNKQVVHVTINGSRSGEHEVIVDRRGKISKRPRIEVPDDLREDMREKIQALREKIDELCAFRSKKKTPEEAGEDYINKTEEIMPLITDLETLLGFHQEPKELVKPLSQVKTSTDALVSKEGRKPGSTPEKVHAAYSEYFPKISQRLDELEAALGLNSSIS